MTTHVPAGEEAAAAPRLNPFAFPSDTDFRFILLIVAVLGSSLFIYRLLYFSVDSNRTTEEEAFERCVQLGTRHRQVEAAFDGKAAFNPVTGLPRDPAALVDAAEAWGQCWRPRQQARAAWMTGGVALLLGVAGVIFWLLPAWKIRRDRLTGLRAEDASEVVTYLSNLCRDAGLSRPPTFLWNPLNPRSGGLAFGRPGRYYVALTGGLVTQFYTDQPAFRAVVLHELAHLRNADVGKTYFTVAIWQAFVVAALVPLAATQLNESPDRILGLGWPAVALAALVYLTRNAVLRAREVYADLRAWVWDGPEGALSRVLATLPRPKADRWRRMLQVHPDPADRRRALADPAELLRMGFWVPFGTGIAATISLPSVDFLLSFLRVETQPIAVALVFAPLAAGVVGLGAWRATFATLARGEAPRGTGHLGLGLGLGTLLGQMLSFDAARASAADLAGSGLLFHFAWGLVLLAGLFLFVQWVAAGASTWLEAAVSSRSPRPAYVVGLTVAAAVLTLGLALLLSVGTLAPADSAPGLGQDLGALIVVAVPQNPLTVLALVSVWAFPLAAWFWRGRAATVADWSWAFLDASPSRPTLPGQTPLRPDVALRHGLAGGLAFCGLLLIVRLGVRLGVSEAILNTVGVKLATFFGQIALAALVQVAVATVVACRVRRLGGLHGLFAAFVAGCVMAVGVLAANLLFGRGVDFTFAWIVFSLVVNGGALPVLPAAFAASAIANWVRRRRARASKSAAAVPAAGPLLTPLAARGAHRAVARRATGHPPD